MGLHIYRAVAECDACGKSKDVGPVETPGDAMALFDDWLFPHGGGTLQWVLSDAFGTRFTVCPECMAKPLADVIAAIAERAAVRA